MHIHLSLYRSRSLFRCVVRGAFRCRCMCLPLATRHLLHREPRKELKNPAKMEEMEAVSNMFEMEAIYAMTNEKCWVCNERRSEERERERETSRTHQHCITPKQATCVDAKFTKEEALSHPAGVRRNRMEPHSECLRRCVGRLCTINMDITEEFLKTVCVINSLFVVRSCCPQPSFNRQTVSGVEREEAADGGCRSHAGRCSTRTVICPPPLSTASRSIRVG